MTGAGKFQYIDLSGTLQTCTHWDQIPSAISEMILFEPRYPDYDPNQPHTDEEHAFLESLVPKLNELMKRCQQLHE